MTSIILCTVPHTGTRFFGGVLEQHFPRIGPGKVAAGVHGYHPMHVSRGHLEWIGENRGRFHLITTKRDWGRVEASWLKRGKQPHRFREAKELWDRLLKFDPIVVSVDHDREKRLKALGERLGVEFTTDWTPVGEWHG